MVLGNFRESDVDKYHFSTLSTGFSTGSRDCGKFSFFVLRVYISRFDVILQNANFFDPKNIDHRKIPTEKNETFRSPEAYRLSANHRLEENDREGEYMCENFTDLCCKEVICVRDGRRLGFVSDARVEVPEGHVLALIVPGPSRLFGLFGRKDD